MSIIKAIGSVLNYFFKETDVTEAAKDELHEVFENLSMCGVVKQSGNGFTFVDVEDRYVTDGVKVIKKFGFDAPPYFGGGLVGAHITVMDEDKSKGVAVKDMLGTEVYFTLLGFNIVKPKGVWEERELFLLLFKADVLDEIREEAGLQKRKYPFHITIGTG